MGASRLGACLLAVGTVFTVSGPPEAAALEFDNGGAFERARHERFLPGSFPTAPVPNPDFFLAVHEPELTGVGWQTSSPGKRAALVSPLHFLNASHYKLGGSITFLGRDGVLHTRTIVRNVKVYQDVAIGTLAEPVPAGVHFFPVVPVVGAETVGREVLYVGRAPGGNAFAVGRTAVAYSSGSGNSLDSRGVDPQWTQDRVRGVSGDSGSPSFVDEGGFLGLLGHHFASYNDLHVGYGPARDAVDDALAADGFAGPKASHAAILSVVEVFNGRAVESGGSGGDSGSCRATRSREVGRFCRDGVDNDCDGVADAADPDC